MLHLHLNECDSTQIYLKNRYNELSKQDESILISTSKQINGIGRQGHHWDDYPSALCFSFNLRPTDNIITVPIALGIILCEYSFKKWKIPLKLKWPNDLLNSNGEKCGGIICQYLNELAIICGVGLNLGNAEKTFTNKHYKMPPGVINPDLILQNDDRKIISKDIYDFIFSYNYLSLNIKDSFEHFCSHLNQNVSITNGDQIHVGHFIGISKNGEALLQLKEGPTQVFISGSLDILTKD